MHSFCTSFSGFFGSFGSSLLQCTCLNRRWISFSILIQLSLRIEMVTLFGCIDTILVNENLYLPKKKETGFFVLEPFLRRSFFVNLMLSSCLKKFF